MHISTLVSTGVYFHKFPGSVWQLWVAYGTWLQSSLEEQHGGDGKEAQGEDGRLEEGARGADEAVGQGGALQQRGER